MRDTFQLCLAVSHIYVPNKFEGGARRVSQFQVVRRFRHPFQGFRYVASVTQGSASLHPGLYAAARSAGCCRNQLKVVAETSTARRRPLCGLLPERKAFSPFWNIPPPAFTRSPVVRARGRDA